MELRFPLILDGATGTELQKRGYTSDVSAEQWVLAHPDSILSIQRDYVAAGSQVLYTPTFGGNAVKLAEHGVTEDTAVYNRRLADLSRQAADGKALLAGDLSPTGLFLAPLGSASFDQLVDAYAQQAAGLEAAGVDLYVIETMMTLSDARAAVLAVRSVSAKPIFVTFTCDQNGRSIFGTDITAALLVLQGMGIDAFGLNCSAGPDQMLPQLRRLREYARIPLIAKPNAGMPTIVNGKAVYDCTPEQFTALVPDMLASGVMIFGGCCGTTPEHIAALRGALDGAAITRANIGRFSFATCEHSFFPALSAQAHREFYEEHFETFLSRRFEGLMEFFSLPMDKPIRSFSTGQKNQFEVIMALSQGADYILMDEPFAGNDVFNREDFYKVLLGILEPHETVILSTHLIEEVTGFIGRAVLLHEGKIVGDAQTAALDEQGLTLMEYVKQTFSYQSDRVSKALAELTGREDDDA